MADNISPKGAGLVPSDDSNSPRQSGQHPLSCTHCRQRKVKCNKIHPCSPCQRSSLECVFPERARHPKKKKNGAKPTNEELLARLNRMEQLIGRMEGEGSTKDETTQLSRPTTAYADKIEASNHVKTEVGAKDGSASPSDGLNRYIGGNFWRSLTGEVGHTQRTQLGFADLPNRYRSRASAKLLMMRQTERTNPHNPNTPLQIPKITIPQTSLAQRSALHETSAFCILLLVTSQTSASYT